MNTGSLQKFYDAHPGIGGPSIKLPSAIKTVLDRYDDQAASISDLLNELNSLSLLVCWAEDGMIMGRLVENNGYIHVWRLLRYRTVEQ